MRVKGKWLIAATAIIATVILVVLLVMAMRDLQVESSDAKQRSVAAVEGVKTDDTELARQHSVRCDRLNWFGGRHCEERETRAYEINDVTAFEKSVSASLKQLGWKEDFSSKPGKFFVYRNSQTSDVLANAWASRYKTVDGRLQQTDLVAITILRHITPSADADFYGTPLSITDETLKQKFADAIKRGYLIAVVVGVSSYEYWL